MSDGFATRARAPGEPRGHTVKRLHMRSMRRGIKEMDLILSSFATARLEGMEDADLALYDRLLDENDHDLYQWVTGQVVPPAPFADLIDQIRTDFSPLR